MQPIRPIALDDVLRAVAVALDGLLTARWPPDAARQFSTDPLPHDGEPLGPVAASLPRDGARVQWHHRRWWWRSRGWSGRRRSADDASLGDERHRTAAAAADATDGRPASDAAAAIVPPSAASRAADLVRALARWHSQGAAEPGLEHPLSALLIIVDGVAGADQNTAGGALLGGFGGEVGREGRGSGHNAGSLYGSLYVASSFHVAHGANLCTHGHGHMVFGGAAGRARSTQLVMWCRFSNPLHRMVRQIYALRRIYAFGGWSRLTYNAHDNGSSSSVSLYRIRTMVLVWGIAQPHERAHCWRFFLDASGCSLGSDS